MTERRTGLYPGTFDPITFGHLDIIERSVKVFDLVIVGVAVNAGKGPLFDIDERVAQVRVEVAGLGDRVVVERLDGLLIQFAKAQGASVIIRGLRAVSDFDYEFQMSSMNAKLAPDIDTICLMASDRYQFIASRLVKEIAALGGDVSAFVPARIAKRLVDRLSRGA